MTVISSFPGTLAAYELPKVRQVEIGADNVQLTLEKASRVFNQGDIVNLSEYEFGLITQASFDEGFVIDRGQIEPVPGDEETFQVDIPLSLASIADGTIATITPGFAGALIGWRFLVTDPVVTASDTTTLTPEIDGDPVQGAEDDATLVIASATATPEGNTIEGDAPASANTFTASESIDIVASSTTPFAEGAGVLQLDLVAS